MTLRIDTQELLLALETHGLEAYHVLDRETGEVVYVPGDWEDLFDEDDPEHERLAQVEDNPRFRRIDPVDSRTGWKWMRDFADDEVEDAGARADLRDALGGSRPFRRFKDALEDHPAVREAWFRYHEDRMLDYARQWLEDEGIDAELSPLPHRQPGVRLAE